MAMTRYVAFFGDDIGYMDAAQCVGRCQRCLDQPGFHRHVSSDKKLEYTGYNCELLFCKLAVLTFVL